MNKFFEILQKNKYAIIWTICYIFIMWGILKWMFNFNIFSSTQWQILMHAHLRGFPGFVFGILILAALPMYIATTMIIVRTKKPLITVKIPKFMQPVPNEDKKKPDDEPNDSAAIKPSTEIDDAPKKSIPTELQFAFDRARLHTGPAPKSNFDIRNIVTSIGNQQLASQPMPDEPTTGELPLPTDFDIDNGISSFTPIFSDVNFDDDEKNDDTTPETPQPTTEQNNLPDELIPVAQYLTAQGINFSISNGLLLTDTDVIAAHIDPDFWVADDETWFAAGKQRPSPIREIINAASTTGLRPVIYLANTNLMDFDTLRENWQNAGITVITDLNELK